MIQTLLTVASVLMFASALLNVQRKWHSRDKLDSTSFEATVANFVGDLFIMCVAVVTSAFIAVAAQVALTFISLLTIYWKLRWIKRKYGLSKFFGFGYRC